MLALRSAPAGYENRPKAEQVAMLRERFADAGWEARRIPDGLDPGTLEFQPVAQVRAPTWSTGRVVLLGDAAYAPAFRPPRSSLLVPRASPCPVASSASARSAAASR